MSSRRIPAALVLLASVATSCSASPAGSTIARDPSVPVVSTAASSTTTGVVATTAPPQRVDDVLAMCPTADDVAFVTSALDLRFDADPTAPDLVCTEAGGSADLTRLQERVVQALLIMERSEFDEPLPWTDLSLFDWLVAAIDGIRFRDDIDLSFCCEPDGYIDIQIANLAALSTDRWIDPASGAGLLGLVGLFAHEARHNEGMPHTCDAVNDQTVLEMGAWAVEALLFRWYAEHADLIFFDDADSPGHYAETAAGDADRILETRICGESGG